MECVSVSHVFGVTDFRWRELLCDVEVRVTADVDEDDNVEVRTTEIHSFAFCTHANGDAFPDWLDELIVEGERGDELIAAVLATKDVDGDVLSEVL
jgi:hypothetical protein